MILPPPPPGEPVTTDTDELALRAAVCAEPADDTPRLVYADRLEENGQPERAEFIRVQCELAKLQPRLAREYHSREGMAESEGWHLLRLRRRERELWPAVHQQVIPLDLHQLVFGGDATMYKPCEVSNANAAIIVRRGFVAELRGTAAALLGGVCWRCDGQGVIGGFIGDNISTPVDYEEHDCSICSGSGRTPGVLRDLCWWPGATDVCPRCEGYGRTRHYRPDVIEFVDDCDHCSETGRVPRPMPPHAQPVTRVVLTTWPEWDDNRYDHSAFPRVAKERLVTEFGPHVEWVMPT